MLDKTSNDCGVFLLTKYSAELKLQIVQDYLSGQYSYNDLVARYNISSHTLIRKWVAAAQEKGLETLQQSRHHRHYSLDQKLSVVDYYQTHDEGLIKVAARFGINASQVASWSRIFNAEGAAGLSPRPKGGLVKMPRKSNRVNKTTKLIKKNGNSVTTDEQLREENIRLRAELYHTQMERDFLKKLRAVSKTKHPARKPK